MPQSIVITGPSGAIGRRVVAALVGEGHRVSGVVRSAEARARVEALGAEAVDADVFDPGSLQRAFAGAGVVINLLTHVPPVGRMAMPGAWRQNTRLRREASRVVATAAAAADVDRLVQESLVYLYADGADAWITEDARLEPAGPPACALAAEGNAREHFAGEVTILRFGAFVGPDSDQSRMYLVQARAGRSMWPGPPDAFVPTIWLDDAAAAVLAAIDAPPGVFNVVDDDPPTRGQIDAALARAVGRDGPLRPVMGGMVSRLPAVRPLARSLRVSNARLRAASRWRPRVHAGFDGWKRIARGTER